MGSKSGLFFNCIHLFRCSAADQLDWWSLVAHGNLVCYSCCWMHRATCSSLWLRLSLRTEAAGSARRCSSAHFICADFVFAHSIHQRIHVFFLAWVCLEFD